jgi:hypothetical protein
VEWVVQDAKKICATEEGKNLANPQLTVRSTNTDTFHYFVEEMQQN